MCQKYQVNALVYTSGKPLTSVEVAKAQTREIVHRIFFHPIGPGCIQVVSARSLPCLGRPKFVFSRNPCRVFHESTLIFSKIIT